jgi:HEAT repeat protein
VSAQACLRFQGGGKPPHSRDDSGMSRPLLIPAIGAALATGLLVFVALVALPWVRDSSGSAVTDFAIIAAWAILAVAASWCQVTLAWRPRSPARDADDASPAVAGLRRTALLRTALLVGATLANLYWSNLAAGDFWFGHYSRIGIEVSNLRSDSAETRRKAVDRIAETGTSSLVDLIGPLSGRLEDADPEVRARAIAALGHICRRMRMAMAVLQQEGGLRDRWEPSALEAARTALGDPVRGIESESGIARRAWISAAGGMAGFSAIPALGRILGDPASPLDDALASLEAMRDMADPRVLVPLLAGLDDRRVEVRRGSAWAIGVVSAAMVRSDAGAADRNPDFLRAQAMMAERLPRMDPQEACAYLVAFPSIGDVRLTAALVAIARSPALGASCERVEHRPAFGKPEVRVPQQSMADLLLRAMVSIAVGNDDLRRYLETAVSDPALDAGYRAGLKGILDQVRTR